jgi:rhodanese-related sulfurtransferase
MPWGTKLTLLGESSEQVAEAQRELVRIGVDRLEGAATGQPTEWTDAPLETLQRATFGDLAQVRHHREVTILDVRRKLEWDESHIDGAVHIPIHDIAKRVGEVPEGEVWIHCAAGYRASIAASIVAASGRTVVYVDDEFDKAAEAGLPMVKPEPVSVS